MQFGFDGFHDRGMAMTRHQCAKTKVVVNIFVAVHVVNLAAFAVFYENWIWLVVAIVAGYSKRDALLGPLMGGGRLRRALLIKRQLFFECFVRHGISPNQACPAPAEPAPCRSLPCRQCVAKTVASFFRDARKRGSRGAAPATSLFSARSP